MSDESEGKKRVTPTNLIQALLVVVVIQVAALLITYQNLPTYQATGPPALPGGSGATGSAVNVVIYVGLAFAATLLLLWLLRRKMVSSFRVLIFTSLAISAFALTFITSDGFFYHYLQPTAELAADIAVSLAVVTLDRLYDLREEPPVAVHRLSSRSSERRWEASSRPYPSRPRSCCRLPSRSTTSTPFSGDP